MTKVRRTANVISRLGDRHPSALDHVIAIPGSWENDEHRLIQLLEECIQQSHQVHLSEAYRLHLESITAIETDCSAEEVDAKPSLENRCSALHRALDDLR